MGIAPPQRSLDGLLSLLVGPFALLPVSSRPRDSLRMYDYVRCYGQNNGDSNRALVDLLQGTYPSLARSHREAVGLC